ncbi:MAG TPA: VTT domain-containing protein [Pseudonocardiaceae bacterium]
MPDFMPQLGMSPMALLALLVVVCAIEATLVLGSIVPGEVALVLAAGMVDPWLLPPVIAAAALGSFLGQYGGYLLGRASGDRIRHGALGRRLGDRRWRRGEHLMGNATVATMVAVRFVAFGHTLAPVAAGALDMPRRRFAGLTAVASVAWSLAWVGVGVITGATGRATDNPLLTVALAAAGVLVASVALARLAGRVSDEPTVAEAASGADVPARAEHLAAVALPRRPIGVPSPRLRALEGPTSRVAVTNSGAESLGWMGPGAPERPGMVAPRELELARAG